MAEGYKTGCNLVKENEWVWRENFKEQNIPNILINSLNKSRVTIAYVKEYIN